MEGCPYRDFQACPIDRVIEYGFVLTAADVVLFKDLKNLFGIF